MLFGRKKKTLYAIKIIKYDIIMSRYCSYTECVFKEMKQVGKILSL